MIRVPALVVSSFAIVVAACASSSSSSSGTEVLHERIVSLQPDADGDTWVGFELSSRAFVIRRVDGGLLQFAKTALAAGKPVYAEVRTGHGDKGKQWGDRAQSPDAKAAIAVVSLGYAPPAR